MSAKTNAMFKPELTGLTLINSGKVREMYAVDDDHMLIVTSDRISAFDVILPDPIPGKGAVLTAVSNFWFTRTESMVGNHLSGMSLSAVVADAGQRESLAERAVIVRRLTPLPVEAIVRGYIIGSGWKDYRSTGAVCGIRLPQGLKQAEILPQPIFTPSTKAAIGNHDENIDFAQTVALLGGELASRVRDISLQIYREAAGYARGKGIIIADTKFEFGTDDNGDLYLIDEVLTPDSSRFWPADSYTVGTSPPSFDKQYVRDYLETLDWDKTPPGPRLPDNVIRNTAAKYHEARRRLIS